jgi:amidase
MSALRWLPALELADLVRRREISPVEVAQQAIDTATALDPLLGAFAHPTPELALTQARALERRLHRAVRDPAQAITVDAMPLLGVPCPVKALDRVHGQPWTCGSAAAADQVADRDDVAVARVVAAGGLVTGLTNTPEFGLPCYTESAVTPPARTPWDLHRSAGGSSGGAAAAVAAGLAPVALGSDGGGSVRIPASACGVVGLKPSRGFVDVGADRVDVVGLATHGALARTVSDAATLLDVLAVTDPGPGQRLRDVAAAAEVRPLRVGLLLQPVITDAYVHPACVQAAEDAAALLGSLGHDVVPAPVPFASSDWDDFRALWAAGAASIPVPPEREAQLVPYTRWLRELGRATSGVSVLEALSRLALVARAARERWADFDLILSPTLATPPLPVGALRDDDDPAADFAAQMRFTPWTSVWNILGSPAVSLPLSWLADEGPVTVPIGVMLGTPGGDDALLVAAAAQVERAAHAQGVGWHDRRPPEPSMRQTPTA